MKRSAILFALLLLAVGFSAAAETKAAAPASAAPAAGALTNADIVKMSKAGLGNELILTKISQAEKVNFKVEPDDLIALKDAGVSQEVISQMVRRAGGGAAAPPAAAASGGDEATPAVHFVGSSGPSDLKSLEGTHHQFAAPFVGLKHFMHFEGGAAGFRSNDRRPTIELTGGADPAKHWWLVKLDPGKNGDARGLDLQSIGMWGGMMTSEPDGDFIISTDLAQGRPGVWQFKPKKDLAPGEYGLYCDKGFVYDFGIDK